MEDIRMFLFVGLICLTIASCSVHYANLADRAALDWFQINLPKR